MIVYLCSGQIERLIVVSEYYDDSPNNHVKSGKFSRSAFHQVLLHVNIMPVTLTSWYSRGLGMRLTCTMFSCPQPSRPCLPGQPAALAYLNTRGITHRGLASENRIGHPSSTYDSHKPLVHVYEQKHHQHTY